MADATSANAQAGIDAGTDLLAIYVTGSADVQWTTAQQALIPAGVTVVTIDQGGTGSPVASANVRDVESGAWTASQAVSEQPWTAPRPTVYCSLDNLSGLSAAGWLGDVWVADWTGSPPTSPTAVPDGMTCVAVQYSDEGGGGTYDLSVVFDPTWPEEADVTIPGLPGQWLTVPQYFNSSDGTTVAVGYGLDNTVWYTTFVPGSSGWTAPVKIG
jgi:hypothetical protein